MKKTAVELLMETLEENGIIDLDLTDSKQYYTIIEQAKEMEKEQIVEAMNRMGNTDFYCEYEDPEQYYNETYKSK